MTYKLEIKGRLPSLNQFISAERTNRFKGASFKAQNQKTVEFFVNQQLKGVQIRNPVRIDYEWYESNYRRDLDNVSGFGHKVIQDALVACGVLEDDDSKHVVGYTDVFTVDREYPHIVVYLEEVENGRC